VGAALAASRATAWAAAAAPEAYTLPNGLRVILARDDARPLVTVRVRYRVGARQDPPGASGLARLLGEITPESMRAGSAPMTSYLQATGALQVASRTGYDETDFAATVARANLAPLLWAEARRMERALEGLSPQVLEERRQAALRELGRRRASPYEQARREAWQALFPDGHPYHGDVLGEEAALRAVQAPAVQAFYETWYQPGQATLVIAGDIEPARARTLVERHFGRLRSREGAPAPAPPPLPAAPGEVRLRSQASAGRLPGLLLLWMMPPSGVPGRAPLLADVLARVLGNGREGRLGRRLARTQGPAFSLQVGVRPLTAAALFFVEAQVRPGEDLAEVERDVDATLETVRAGAVTPAELRAACLGLRTDRLLAVDDPLARTQLLLEQDAAGALAEALADGPAGCGDITPAQLGRFASEVLVRERRAVARVEAPRAGAKGAPGP
jgi:zinc protease